jgi:serine/threonine-protein kinase
MKHLVGQTLGRYRIIEPLGEGGMAYVYKAFQSGLERVVAIKVLPEFYLRDERFLTRFQREAQAIAQLSHPNILPVYDFGREGNLTYIVMQYVEGGTLKDKMDQVLSFEEVGGLLGQVADALDYAHKQGILHRDVKPTNILIEREQRVLLSDFGLAKMVGSQVHITTTGVGIGTPAYMSPEQGQGEAVDARTDIYALGVVMYEMITGRVPFRAETPMAVIIKHVTAPLPLPRTINPAVPESLEQVILKALAKNKVDRYASAGAMMRAYRQALVEAPGPLTAPPPEAETGSLCPRCGQANRPDVRYCEQCALPLAADSDFACSRCGHTNRPGVRFCEQCAASLVGTGPTCPQCGHVNRPGLRFCEQCAASLVA